MEDKGIASAVNFKKITEQNNYTNIFLKTLGDQLNRVEKIVETQDHIKTNFAKKDNKPLFMSFELSKKFQENLFVDQDLIKRISEKVKESLIVPETPQPSSHRRINAIDEEISSKAEADELNKIFKKFQDKKFQEFFITKKPLRLEILILSQSFLICSMRKETNILKLLIQVVPFMNGI